jgi:hypothetical protein
MVCWLPHTSEPRRGAACRPAGRKPRGAHASHWRSRSGGAGRAAVRGPRVTIARIGGSRSRGPGLWSANGRIAPRAPGRPLPRRSAPQPRPRALGRGGAWAGRWCGGWASAALPAPGRSGRAGPHWRTRTRCASPPPRSRRPCPALTRGWPPAMALHGGERRPRRRETRGAWPATVCSRSTARPRSPWGGPWPGQASGLPKPGWPGRPPRGSRRSPRLGGGPSGGAHPCVWGSPRTRRRASGGLPQRFQRGPSGMARSSAGGMGPSRGGKPPAVPT